MIGWRDSGREGQPGWREHWLPEAVSRGTGVGIRVREQEPGNPTLRRLQGLYQQLVTSEALTGDPPA